MYPEDEELKTMPLQSFDNASTPVQTPAQDSISQSNPTPDVTAQTAQAPQTAQTVAQGNTYQNYTAQPQNNAYQNYSAQGQNNVYQNYSAQGQNNAYQNYSAQGQNNAYQNYTAQPQNNAYQNYTAQPQNNAYQNYAAQGQNNAYQNYSAQPQNNAYQNYGATQGMAQGFQNYQQPNQAYAQQNPYYANPVNGNVNNGAVPPAKVAKKKIPKLAIIIPIAVVLIAAIVVAVILIFKDKGKNETQETVETAMSNTFKEESPTVLASYLGTEEMNTMLESGAYTTSVSLNITDLSGYSMPSEAYLFEGLGFSTTSSVDIASEKVFSCVDVMYGGISYLDFNMYAYSDFMAVALPSLFNGYIEFKTTNFAEDFNNSPLAAMLGSDMQLPAELSFDYFEYLTSLSASMTVPEEVNEFLDSIQYEKSGSAEVGSLGKCDGYTVTITTDSMKDLLKWFCDTCNENNVTVSYAEFEQLLPKENIVFNIYVDDKGRMVRFSYVDDFNVDGTTLNVNANIDFLGTNRPADIVTGSIDLTADGTTVSIVIDSKTTESSTSSVTNATFSLNMAGSTMGSITYYSAFDSTNGNYDMTLSVDAMGTNYVYATMDGAYSNVVPGQSFTFDINDLTVNVMNGEYCVSLNGSMSQAPLSGSVEQPSGTKYDLFTMTEADFTALGEEIMNNVMNGPIGSLVTSMMYGYSSYESYDDDYYYDEYNYDDYYYEDDWYYEEW